MRLFVSRQTPKLIFGYDRYESRKQGKSHNEKIKLRGGSICVMFLKKKMFLQYEVVCLTPSPQAGIFVYKRFESGK